jgi:DNA-binding NarL/FixJ family response regulator
VRVLLADDHEILREGLRSLIEEQPDMEIIGEADNGRDAVKLAEELSPDVVIMDVSMPDLNGMEATRQIVKKLPEAKVIALSMHSDKGFVAEMLKAGAVGYLLKDGAFKRLAEAIKTTRSGGTYLCPEVADVVREDYIRRLSAKEPPVAPKLTPREREVLQLVAEGWATKQIARKLNMSTKTAEGHRTRIMKKLDLHSVADLTKYAIREGLTSLDG